MIIFLSIIVLSLIYLNINLWISEHASCKPPGSHSTTCLHVASTKTTNIYQSCHVDQSHASFRWIIYNHKLSLHFSATNQKSKCTSSLVQYTFLSLTSTLSKHNTQPPLKFLSKKTHLFQEKHQLCSRLFGFFIVGSVLFC